MGMVRAQDPGPSLWLATRRTRSFFLSPCSTSRTHLLHLPARLAGVSRWDCRMIWISRLALGSTMPLEGRTQYFLGLVVFTLKAIRSPRGF